MKRPVVPPLFTECLACDSPETPSTSGQTMEPGLRGPSAPVRVHRLIEADHEVLVAENTHLRSELQERYGFSNLVGTSGAMQEMYQQISQVAPTNTTVLLRRESGTGKELTARQEAVHQGQLRGAPAGPHRV
jgi:transcriptional regulator with GAF, ATPase, and Fis domain